MLFLIILLIIICVALGLFVLIQNPKGGGLATGGSGSNMFGVQRTGDVLEKGTWVLLTLIVVISLAITTIGKTGGASTGSGSSKIQEHLDKTPTPSPIGGNVAPQTTAPAPAPADTAK
ncbi:preprotein translocase subunit SecG [Pedobacter antarcticus]|uniref:Protein-export membrane protein SecG n=2 Tax=Pedobacter antarcticus TaxID=34086 RepID=A0A081PF70_9SPHI|nr:preprotein translocase subunit SecG [Pedobacter antarcticus]KEQ29343.1 preprotein translocase subunit SecG [Pedobacter antarcticus 4BY]SDL96333.1 preprotein translocase subunit SecG [Pedobacter antarcticus]SFE77664.1 preprotein translocase subunit SecG [Pedobacter antarcticus]